MPGAKAAAHRKKARKNRLKKGLGKRSYAKEGFLDHHTTTEEVPPKSFIIQQGVSSSAIRYLISDFKKVMKPNTAERLKARKGNVLKDFVSLASEFAVSHMVIFSQKDSGIYMKVARTPHGPTLTYKVESYSLAKDVTKSQKRPMTYSGAFATPACLITNLQPSEGENHLKLSSQMFLNMFPNINPVKQKLSDIRRSCLIYYNESTELYDFRHYCIRMRPVGISKGTRKLLKGKVPNLKKFSDVSDLMMKSELLSETEAEDDEKTTIDLSKDDAKGKVSLSRSAVRLSEIGPRLTLKLIKIQEGLSKGTILFELPEVKTEVKEETVEDAKQDKNGENGNQLNGHQEDLDEEEGDEEEDIYEDDGDDEDEGDDEDVSMEEV